jgi:hypothetical protein
MIVGEGGDGALVTSRLDSGNGLGDRIETRVRIKRIGALSRAIAVSRSEALGSANGATLTFGEATVGRFGTARCSASVSVFILNESDKYQRTDVIALRFCAQASGVDAASIGRDFP